MPKKSIKGLLSETTQEIDQDEILVKGKGLSGLIVESESDKVNNLTNQQVKKLTSKQGDNRVIKGYRINKALATQIDILAAQEQRKIYEVVEEAFSEYLERRHSQSA